MPARTYNDIVAQLLGLGDEPAAQPGDRSMGLGPQGSSYRNPYSAPLMGGAGTMFPPLPGLQFNPRAQLDPSQVSWGTNPWWGFVGQPRLPYYDPVGQFQVDPFSVGLARQGYPPVPTNYPYGPSWDEFVNPGAGASGPGAY
jgi:hypothetical protein